VAISEVFINITVNKIFKTNILDWINATADDSINEKKVKIDWYDKSKKIFKEIKLRRISDLPTRNLGKKSVSVDETNREMKNYFLPKNPTTNSIVQKRMFSESMEKVLNQETTMKLK